MLLSLNGSDAGNKRGSKTINGQENHMKMRIVGGLATCLILLTCASLGQASTITIGAPPDPSTGNCVPFGCAFGTIYQQVYNSTLFPGPIAITGITFFSIQNPGGVIAPGTYTISLSTTSKAVNGLDTTTFTNNIGADNQAFFSGTLSGAVAGGQLTFTGPAFSYDPSKGNLLFNLGVSYTPAGGSVFMDARTLTAAGAFSRATDSGFVGFDNTGLETQFTYQATTPVPEPGAMLFVASGLIGLCFRKGRKTLA
jgi:hypothetical protein